MDRQWHPVLPDDPGGRSPPGKIGPCGHVLCVSLSMPLDRDDNRTRFEAAALPLIGTLHRTAFRLTRSREDAADVVQETFLRAYRTFSNFAPGTNCKAWLFTIMYSVFVNRYRKAKREPMLVSLEEVEERFHRGVTAEWGPDPDAGDVGAAWPRTEAG